MLSINEAQKIANEYLIKLNMQHIGLLRKSQCSSIEIFFTMFIRALMSKKKTIIIESPLLIINNIRDIEIIIQKIDLLNNDKKILIIDTIANEAHYKGCTCHIIK